MTRTGAAPMIVGFSGVPFLKLLNTRFKVMATMAAAEIPEPRMVCAHVGKS